MPTNKHFPPGVPPPQQALSSWSEAARARAGTVARALGLTDSRRSTAWAVVDAARQKGSVYELLEQHARLYPQDIQCLFDGRAFHAMSRQGPWLVDLRRLNSPLFAHWFGQAWGIFAATASMDIAKVKRHFKKILTVWLENPHEDSVPPAKALYRFYDPRVLRSTLPFFSYYFTRGMFGEVIEAYLCEGVRLAQTGDGQTTIGELYRYRLPREGFFQELTRESNLQTDTLNLPGHTILAQQPPTKPEEIITP